jgi:hypothetical protein
MRNPVPAPTATPVPVAACAYAADGAAASAASATALIKNLRIVPSFLLLMDHLKTVSRAIRSAQGS